MSSPERLRSVLGEIFEGRSQLVTYHAMFSPDTPIRAASEARCRERSSLHGPLPFSLVRSALIVGAKYGLSCVGCSAGLMVAMAIIGVSNLVWIVFLAGVVLVYKLAPAPSVRRK